MMPMIMGMMKGMHKVWRMEEMGEATVMGMMIQVITMITMKPDTKKVMKKDMMMATMKANPSMRKNKRLKKKDGNKNIALLP